MSIKFYGKSNEVADEIIKQFETGNMEKALANIFISRSDHIPSSAWSWNNRFIMAIRGTADARGFKQWKDAGRKVSKGAKALHILAPCIGKRKEQDPATGEIKEVKFIYGFKSVPVFAIESTEIVDAEKWSQNSGIDHAEESRLQNLPLREVADAWSLQVTSYNGQAGKASGWYRHGQAIALGVENLSTWTHELTHAADDRLNTLTKKPGQQQDNEIVAELGGAVLLRVMGYNREADIGGAWDYIKAYSKGDKSKAIQLCNKFINRVCNCVDLIIETALELGSAQEIKAA